VKCKIKLKIYKPAAARQVVPADRKLSGHNVGDEPVQKSATFVLKKKTRIISTKTFVKKRNIITIAR